MSSDNDNNKGRRIGIKIDGESEVYAKGNIFENQDHAMVVDGNSKLHAEDNIIRTSQISKNELENFQNDLSNLQKAITELKETSDEKLWEKTLKNLTPAAYKMFIGYLKAQGHIE